MSASEEYVSKGGDAYGKRDFGTEQKCELMRIAGEARDGGAVVAGKIGSDAKEGQEAIGGCEFPAIEVLPVGDGKEYYRGSRALGAKLFSLDSDRGTEIGIAAEENEFVLSGKGRGREGEKNKGNEETKVASHDGTSDGQPTRLRWDAEREEIVG